MECIWCKLEQISPIISYTTLCKYSVNMTYNTKVSRDKTFAVRSPCEYSWKNFHVCISIAQNDVLKIFKCLNILKFMEKHSRFKEKPRIPRKFCPSNLLYYTVLHDFIIRIFDHSAGQKLARLFYGSVGYLMLVWLQLEYLIIQQVKNWPDYSLGQWVILVSDVYPVAVLDCIYNSTYTYSCHVYYCIMQS